MDHPNNAVVSHSRYAAVDRGDLCLALREHYRYLLRVAFSILKSVPDAEDAVQAGSLAAWMAYERFRGQSSLKTWLTSIVVNKALGQRTACSRHVCLSMDAEPAVAVEVEWHQAWARHTPEQSVLRNESIHRVRSRMARLPEQTKSIVDLHYFREWSIDEIAQEKHASQSSVRAHLSRGRAELRRGVAVLSPRNMKRMQHRSQA